MINYVCNNRNFINSSKPLSQANSNKAKLCTKFSVWWELLPWPAPGREGGTAYVMGCAKELGSEQRRYLGKAAETLNLSSVFENWCPLHFTIAHYHMSFCECYFSGVHDDGYILSGMHPYRMCILCDHLSLCSLRLIVYKLIFMLFILIVLWLEQY